jgi:hypothetical protein
VESWIPFFSLTSSAEGEIWERKKEGKEEEKKRKGRD